MPSRFPILPEQSVGRSSAVAAPMAAAGVASQQLVPGFSAVLAKLFVTPVAASELRGEGDPEWLFAEERAQLANAMPTRLAEFAAGRACARTALAGLGIDTSGPLLRGAHREPLWPAEVTGSITHTQGFCGCAVARKTAYAGLGIDAERTGRVSAHLWESLFDGDEHAALERLAEPARDRLATLLFAAKEAFFKSQFPLTGAIPEFKAVRIVVRGSIAATGAFAIVAAADRNLARLALPLTGRYVFETSTVFAGLAIRNQDLV